MVSPSSTTESVADSLFWRTPLESSQPASSESTPELEPPCSPRLPSQPLSKPKQLILGASKADRIHLDLSMPLVVSRCFACQECGHEFPISAAGRCLTYLFILKMVLINNGVVHSSLNAALFCGSMRLAPSHFSAFNFRL